jgi:hypothetical protein
LRTDRCDEKSEFVIIAIADNVVGKIRIGRKVASDDITSFISCELEFGIEYVNDQHKGSTSEWPGGLLQNLGI